MAHQKKHVAIQVDINLYLHLEIIFQLLISQNHILDMYNTDFQFLKLQYR